jgi:hypothetical protein
VRVVARGPQRSGRTASVIGRAAQQQRGGRIHAIAPDVSAELWVPDGFEVELVATET